ncbi:MAG: hypothetical protein PHX51_01865 [Clostridia bacterium]|nr:hypothetical protein [Clostridia bacterium]
MQQLDDFLIEYGLSESCICAEETIGNFGRQIVNGLKGEASLKMLPSYLSPFSEIVYGKPFAVADAGGSNLRCAVATYEKSGCVIKSLYTTRMPAIDRKMTAEQFYSSVARSMRSALNIADDIGFCFSYPVEMDDSVDGKLINFTKEIKVIGADGKYVGCSLLEAVAKHDSRKRRIAILNDTVATLLGGLSIDLRKRYDDYIGFIYGTGVNACYIEDVEGICAPLGNYKYTSMIINIEAGNFDGLKRGIIDIELDEHTENYGAYPLEKMISGRYLGEIIIRALVEATRNKVIASDLLAENVKDFSTRTVNAFLGGEMNNLYSKFHSDTDVKSAKSICFSVIKRAAKIAAIVLASIILHRAKDNRKEFAIIVEGTTFFKMEGLIGYIEGYLSAFLSNKDIKFTFIGGDNLNFAGAMRAVMQLK